MHIWPYNFDSFEYKGSALLVSINAQVAQVLSKGKCGSAHGWCVKCYVALIFPQRVN